MINAPVLPHLFFLSFPLPLNYVQELKTPTTVLSFWWGRYPGGIGDSHRLSGGVLFV